MTKGEEAGNGWSRGSSTLKIDAMRWSVGLCVRPELRAMDQSSAFLLFPYKYHLCGQRTGDRISCPARNPTTSLLLPLLLRPSLCAAAPSPLLPAPFDPDDPSHNLPLLSPVASFRRDQQQPINRERQHPTSVPLLLRPQPVPTTSSSLSWASAQTRPELSCSDASSD